MPEHVDVIVVGAGVVGLAIARALAVSGHDIVVLESESSIGTGISSRNSEVIHAGIYYPKDSLKQRLSIRGRKLLYRYCMDRAVDIKQLGKLIVATTELEISQLEMLRRRAVHNGVNELVWLDQNKALALEPELRCVAALLSPSTGIVDSHALMLALQGDAEAAGATFAFRSPFIAGRSDGEKLIVDVGGSDAIELSCNWLVNAAGLDAVNVAARFVGLSKKHVPRSWLCKGHYFALRGPSPFSHLIYPVPEQAGLGVHLTLDLAGQARFGPDTEWITEINYDVDQQRAARFYTSIQRYWPALAAGSLLSGYAGIRPKISGPLDPAADFRIDGPKFHGVGGLINLFGIESPGLTAALAIADEVNHVIQSGEPSGVAKM